MIMETKDRIEKAVELFKSGYNCSQSVVGAFADMYGFTEEQAFGIEKTGRFVRSGSPYRAVLC